MAIELPTADVPLIGSPYDLRVGLGEKVGETDIKSAVESGDWGFVHSFQAGSAVDGPGALPGFDFRSPRSGVDVGTCSSGIPAPGRPAECDRIALAQIEYRGDLRLNFTGDWEDWPRRMHSMHGDVSWVFFADAGRGWKTSAPPDGSLNYETGDIPALSTFRADLGLSLDFAGIGVYAAKSVSTPAEPINFFVRLRHRF